MREVEKKDSSPTQKVDVKKALSYDDQKKSKSLQNRLSKVESNIKDLERDIQQDDKALASNYDKHIEDARFFTAYNKKKADLDKLLEEWEVVQEEIDNL